MSSKFIIDVKNISKKFKIYDNNRKRLKEILFLNKKKYHNEFWALKKIDLKIKKGETIGIVGPNGSGKSTLLQIICGIIEPTEGTIETKGKIAALLELGSGFNPEFTGRENIYFNGALLGLTKEAIDRSFHLIENFADIGLFIDQPVKTYSSGMVVRLAFAVIAHVNADTLVIDEALAVGDAIFNQKCMRFLRGFKEKGNLIIVSHDMNSVVSMCDNAILLNKGEVQYYGSAKEVAEFYQKKINEKGIIKEIELKSLETNVSHNRFKVINELKKTENFYSSEGSFVNRLNESNGWKSGHGEIISVSLKQINSDQNEVFKGGEIVKLTITAKVNEKFEKPILGFAVRDRLGQDLFGENTLVIEDGTPLIDKSQYCEADFVFKIPMLPNGQYFVMASLANGDLYQHVQHHWLHESAVINISSSKIRWGLVGIEFSEVAFRKICDDSTCTAKGVES